MSLPPVVKSISKEFDMISLDQMSKNLTGKIKKSYKMRRMFNNSVTPVLKKLPGIFYP
jgi:hypothetical protein